MFTKAQCGFPISKALSQMIAGDSVSNALHVDNAIFFKDFGDAAVTLWLLICTTVITTAVG